jgi:alkylated DNA repair dioxygenase AlkB
MRLGAGRSELTQGGSVWFAPAWLAPSEADILFRELLHAVAWEQGSVQLFGRDVPEPRLTAWFGDADYTYSGRTLRAAHWPPALARLRARVDAEVERVRKDSDPQHSGFNAVLLNFYRDGKDSMGMHSDDEPELGVDPTVASVSLGQERTFVLAPKKKSARPTDTREISLGHGSLLVMLGSCQHRYRHGIPKEPARSGARINLTFRRVLAGAIAR